jgi:toxin ParE1/3/4
MEYLVKITPRAERDLAYLFRNINAAQSKSALKWYWSLKDAILRLRKYPSRCPLARNCGTLRHLLYGRKPNVYRVIFRIVKSQKCVEILHIRHGARRELKEIYLR